MDALFTPMQCAIAFSLFTVIAMIVIIMKDERT